MNPHALVKSVWNRIHKIKVKESSNTIHHLFVNDRNVTSHCDIANALADNFLIILPLLSAQMHSHQYITKLKSKMLTFHLKMLTYATGPSLCINCRKFYVELVILQQD